MKALAQEFMQGAPSPAPSPSRGEGCKSSPPLRGGEEGEGVLCGLARRRIGKSIARTAFSAVLLFSLASFSSSGEEPITPYGGYCKDCAVYGSCRQSIPPGEAIQSLRRYYEERGYRLGAVSHKGRFIEAEVLQNSRQVDKVIFDRKTGRMRSMY